MQVIAHVLVRFFAIQHTLGLATLSTADLETGMLISAVMKTFVFEIVVVIRVRALLVAARH